MSDDEMTLWQAMMDEQKRRHLHPAIADSNRLLVFHDPDSLIMPLSMSFDLPKPPAVDFIFGTRFGGLDIRPRDRIITVVPPPGWMQALMDDGWKMRRASTWREVVVVDCETPMVVGLHPFVRVRLNDAHPEPSSLGNWRVDDDHGSAHEAKHVRVDRYVCEGSTSSGMSHRAWLAPVGPIFHEDEWQRLDGGLIADTRVESGRYASRLPTNRKAKRARCKARRRARLHRRHWVARRRNS